LDRISAGAPDVASAPRVSVVTPFYNTAKYLEACIQSVLGQTLTDFEYILVNNQSTDGSRDIAARCAAQDSRIRLFDNPAFVGQVENYNGALAQISGGTRWVKLIQADDELLPEALEKLVQAGEKSPRIGLVGSLYLKGHKPSGGGLPMGTAQIDGRELCRRMLLTTDCFPLGSPSAVLYRADLVRTRKPFYALGRYHEDTEAAYELLLEHDFGFVHQVLAFLRTDNISIMSAMRRFSPDGLDHLTLLSIYGPRVLTPEEQQRQFYWEWRAYLGFLGESVWMFREKEFWKYHRDGLSQSGRSLRFRELLPAALKAGGRLLLNPLTTVRQWRSRGRPQ
jgi:glycosyltransferase involved in cell wall biosynthesis